MFIGGPTFSNGECPVFVTAFVRLFAFKKTHKNTVVDGDGSYRTTANLFILNTSETELLVIGLKQRFAKIHNSSMPGHLVLSQLAVNTVDT